MILTGRPVPEIASSLGITTGMIYKWRVAHTRTATGSQALNLIVEPEVSGAEHERLKNRLREVEQERDILKKADGSYLNSLERKILK